LVGKVNLWRGVHVGIIRGIDIDVRIGGRKRNRSDRKTCS
jgi:hypothetical protein